MKVKVNTMMMRIGTAAVVLGMTLCGWSGDEWPDRSRVTFGTYCLSKPYRTEANFKDMKACGIDFVCENFGDDPQSIETMRKLGLVSVCAGGFPTYWGGDDSVNGHIAELAPLEKYEAARKASAACRPISPASRARPRNGSSRIRRREFRASTSIRRITCPRRSLTTSEAPTVCRSWWASSCLGTEWDANARFSCSPQTIPGTNIPRIGSSASARPIGSAWSDPTGR